jgi:hypothetical protein
VKFSPEELADPERGIKRLLLATQDMAEARGAVEFLNSSTHLNSNVRRALETAIPVAYSRPWGKANTIGALGDHWLPETPGWLELHRALIVIRNKVYAHTDEEINARGIVDISPMTGGAGPVFATEWVPLDPHPAIAQLAARQRDRFSEGARELQERLASSG